MRRWLAPLACGGLLWALPAPAGLTPAAWHYTAVFVFVVVGLIAEPMPASVIGLIGLSIVASLQLVGSTPAEALRWALSGFSNDVVWLIFAATTFALGYEATGLGRRIALLLVRALGRSTLGLGYAVALAELLLAPFMPSNTARSAGTIFPIVRNIPPLYGSTPAQNPRAIGAYISWVAFATTAVTSAMFVTAMAPNLLATQLAQRIAGVEITWTGWMFGILPLGLLLFVLTPLVTYLVYPPAIRRAPEVVAWAADELAGLGRISRRELTMGVLAVIALVCWILAGRFIAPATVALGVVSLMIVTGVITWNDVVGNRQGWNVLVWFATLVAMADGLGQVGFLGWFAGRSAAMLSGFPATVIGVGLVAIFFLSHYLFASTTAHTTAVLPPFLAVVVSIPGLPVDAIVRTLVYSIGLMAVLTPYATGPAPVWFSAGYIGARDFWKLGGLMGALFLAGLVGVALPYLAWR